MLCYEMHLLCKRQIAIGIQHPVSFGIYWAASRFMLYCMEAVKTLWVDPEWKDKGKEKVKEGEDQLCSTGYKFVPHLLLQLSAKKRTFLPSSFILLI
jgi:hypothetical protein